MIIGPDLASNILEIGLIERSDDLVVIHAMKARKDFFR